MLQWIRDFLTTAFVIATGVFGGILMWYTFLFLIGEYLRRHASIVSS